MPIYTHIYTFLFLYNMRHCLSLKSRQPSPSSSTTNTTISTVLQVGNSREEETSRSSSEHQSPITTINLNYNHALQTSSYGEIRTQILANDHENEEENELVSLSQVLRPDRECVEEALRHAMPSTLTSIVSLYFDHSEKTSSLCLILIHSVRRARALYAPLLGLLDTFPLDSNSLAQSHFDWAFDVFHQFDSIDNPFPSPDSHNFHEMRRCFLQLKQQLDCRRRKSLTHHNRRHCAKTGGAICLIGATVFVVVSAVAIAGHALVAVVAGGGALFTSACLPPKLSRKEVAHFAKLDAAARGIFVLNNDLDTIDRLVARLHAAVESDKVLIRLGLERGKDKHPIQWVVQQLQKNHRNFLDHLQDLEDHICLCFAAVNRARSLLLQEIHLHQTCNS